MSTTTSILNDIIHAVEDPAILSGIQKFMVLAKEVGSSNSIAGKEQAIVTFLEAEFPEADTQIEAVQTVISICATLMHLSLPAPALAPAAPLSVSDTPPESALPLD